MWFLDKPSKINMNAWTAKYMILLLFYAGNIWSRRQIILDSQYWSGWLSTIRHGPSPNHRRTSWRNRMCNSFQRCGSIFQLEIKGSCFPAKEGAPKSCIDICRHLYLEIWSHQPRQEAWYVRVLHYQPTTEILVTLIHWLFQGKKCLHDFIQLLQVLSTL